ncbi:MAG: hypothetical protein A3J83_00990 [Elusimicrobia bacterium RIFOXYA2_FULL_40_6]|nr:MAG: hypothetical protein A3J83_00990 [Elusimicrobia bacterium RIFOXYA2_FULL_40_6]
MNKNSIGLLLVVILSLISGFFVYKQWAKEPRSLKWDNAWHAVLASEIANDIKSGDIKSLLYDTNKQTLHPFMESYIWGVFFVFFGISEISAAICALIIFLMSLIMLYKICTLLDEKNGWVIGLLSCLLMLYVPINLVYATQIMTEIPCMFLILATVYCYFRSSEERGIFFSLCSGLAVATLFFTKYNYGFILFIFMMSWETIHYKNIDFRKFLVLALPAVIFSLAWFSFDRVNKINGFMNFVLSRSSGIGFLTSENWFLYPKLIMQNYIPSRVLFWIITALFAIVLLNVRKIDKKIQFIVSLFIIFIFAATYHPIKDSRYILPIFPFLIIIVLSGIPGDKISRIFRFALFFLISFILFFNINKSYSVDLPFMYSSLYGDKDTNTIVSEVADSIIENKMRRTFLMGTFNELNNYVFVWSLYTKGSGLAREVNSFDDIPYPKQFDLVEFDYKMDKSYINAFNSWLETSKYSSVVTFEVDDKVSAYKTNDYIRYNKWKQNYVRLFKSQKKYKLIDELKFPEKGVTVRFYTKKA